MAVAAMKLVTITGETEQFSAVVNHCVLGQEFQPVYAQQYTPPGKNVLPMSGDDPYAAPLRQAEELAEQLSVPLRCVPFDGDQELWEEGTSYLEELSARLSKLTSRRTDLEEKNAFREEQINQLSNLTGISESIHDLRSMRFAKFRYGHLSRETYNSFSGAINDRPDVFFFPTALQKQEVYGIYFVLRDSADEVDAMFRSLHFVRIKAEHPVEENAKDGVARFQQEIREAEEELKTVEQEISGLRQEAEEKLVYYAAWLRFRHEGCDLQRYALESKGFFILMGWVPKEALAQMEKLLADFPETSCVADDPKTVKATPPVKLKGGLLSRVFHPYLSMYGLPRYDEIDPSTFMAVTYAIFFGMMYGDVGHGVCLFLAGLLMYKAKGMWIGRVLMVCAFPAAFFGCVFNSVFGIEDILPWQGLSVMENIAFILIASLAIGAVMILLVMVLNIVNGIRQRDVGKTVFSANGFAGLIFYLGILLLALSILGYLPIKLATPLYVLPVLILPIVCIWFQEPLTMLCTRDPELKTFKVSGVLVSGFFEVFETLLSYLTNTLSFMRIGAYAVTHVGLMTVVQVLAGDTMGVRFILVMVLGNAFVMGFEGLLVAIQVLRLEFYELFGRFYSDSGQEFAPKVIDYAGSAH